MKIQVSENFRQSISWFHTWLGIGLSAILFAVFWTGSLTVFDKEIDQWMKPELRGLRVEQQALDNVVLPYLENQQLKPGSVVWIGPPRERIPGYRLFYEDAQEQSHSVLLHPESGEPLDLTDSHAGSEFFFRFHFMLLLPGAIGYYIVAVAALGMMLLIISGIFVHRKIFQEFFTFRPKVKIRRSLLDLHNLTGVLPLPFHFMIPFSGLLILITTYFPWSMAVPYDGDLNKLNEALSAYERPKIKAANEPAPMVSELDTYIAKADKIWRSKEGERTSDADWIALFNVNDANTYIVVERFFANKRVAIGPDQIVFDPKSGDIIDQFSPLPVHRASTWIEGLHWIQFDHWPLRWLYFFAGLAGCIMIASGLIYWIQSRLKKLESNPLLAKVVSAMSIGAVTGIIIATGAFFISNRLIPKDLPLQNIHRHDIEIWVFFGIWLSSFIHAALRGKFAWKEQSWAIVAVSVLSVLFNWVTTGDHLVSALFNGVWATAIMDMMIILTGCIAYWAARKLAQYQ